MQEEPKADAVGGNAALPQPMQVMPFVDGREAFVMCRLCQQIRGVTTRAQWLKAPILGEVAVRANLGQSGHRLGRERCWG